MAANILRNIRIIDSLIIDKFKLVSVCLVIFSLLGCQTTSNKKSTLDIASVKQELQEVSVAVPPRDPFVTFTDIPKSPQDIQNYEDCGVLPEEELDTIIQREKEEHSFIKESDAVYSYPRQYAEMLFHNGEPRHAALYLEELAPWNPNHLNTGYMDSQAYLAIYYAAYGELSRAKQNFRFAVNAVNSWRHPEPSCDAKRLYYLKRATAYLAIAEAEDQDALKAIMGARQWMETNMSYSYFNDGCGRNLHEKWRDVELDVLSAAALLQLGDLDKAETCALRAYKDSNRKLEKVYGRKALHILGQIKFHQARYQDALSFFLMAKRSQRTVCIPLSAPERAAVNRDIALTLVALNKFAEAYEIFQEIQSNLKNEQEIWNNLFATSLERGIVLRETGHNAEAREVFESAVKNYKRSYGKKHYNTLEAKLLLALLDDSTPVNSLTQQFSTIIAQRLELTANLAGTPINYSIRMNWMLEDYLSKVFSSSPSQHTLERAFEIADNLQIGVVQQTLAKTALRRIAPNQEARDLIRDKQDLENKLIVLRQLLNDGITYGQVEAETLESLKSKIEITEEIIAQSEAQLRKFISNYDAITKTSAFEIEQLRKALLPDEALVVVTGGRKESFVWVVTKDERISGISVKRTQQQWYESVERVRESIRPINGRLDSLLRFDTRTAHILYKDLLQATEDHWSPAKHLIFVTNNALSSLPLGMLLQEPTSGIPEGTPLLSGYRKLPWLIKTHAISAVPSASTLALLRSGKSSSDIKRAFLGFGDPVFNPDEQLNVAATDKQRSGNEKITLRAISTTQDLDTTALKNLARLPDTADEIRSIAEILDANLERDIFLGHRANEAVIHEMNENNILYDYRILSFATHGLVPGDLDGLQSPALALSQPQVETQNSRDDGLLTAEEIMELELDADWAILSACNTASTHINSSDAYSGLGKAFFYAGARSLLLSNWPVYSDATRQLMVELFRVEKDIGKRAEALRVASLNIMNQGIFNEGGEYEFSYAHPLFWAPFTLVGDGGGH